MNITLLYIWRVASTRSGCKSTIYHYSSLTIDPNLQQGILVGYHLGVVPSDIELQVCFRVLIFLEIRPPTIQICFLLFFFVFSCLLKLLYQEQLHTTIQHQYLFLFILPKNIYNIYIYVYGIDNIYTYNFRTSRCATHPQRFLQVRCLPFPLWIWLAPKIRQWGEPNLMVQKSGVHHLRLVLYPPYVQGFFRTIPGGCLGFQPSTVVSLWQMAMNLCF